MPLPDLIEIVPLTQPVRAEITVPGSKSITNRALILAALADGEVTLQGALWSEDTQIMVECLHQLGFDVKVMDDPAEFCNRTITVKGQGGKIPKAGTTVAPLELFVGNAGTAARFLAAFVCLGQGAYRLSGVPRMHERPQAALFQALRELGYEVEATGDKLPAVIAGAGPKPGATGTVSIAKSSQFASALLLSAEIGGWTIEVVGENAEESPYVAMTSKLMAAFPKRGGTFSIEPDASSGSYFWAAGKIADPSAFMEYSKQYGVEVRTQYHNKVIVTKWPASGWQIDERFFEFMQLGGLMRFLGRGKTVETTNLNLLKEVIENEKYEVSRLHDLGDSIMTAIIFASVPPGSPAGIKFTDLGRLRLQECERVVALRTELTKCGGNVVEAGDTLTVYPSELHGAEIETYNDHRMAMCFAILGLKVPGIKLKNPACVKKTFPNFFQKLAAPAPHGLGAAILDGTTGRKLELTELFAD